MQEWFPPSQPLSNDWQPPNNPIWSPPSAPVVDTPRRTPKLSSEDIPKFLRGGLADISMPAPERLGNILHGPSTDSSGRPIVGGVDKTPLLPEWKKQPDTYLGGFGRSLYNDILRPFTSAEGILGSSIPGPNKLIPKQLPPAKLYGGPSGGSGRVAIGDDLLDRTGTAEIIGKPPIIDIPKSDYSISSNPIDSRISGVLDEGSPYPWIDRRQGGVLQEGMQERRNVELLDKFGGRQVLDQPQALSAIGQLPDNTIPLGASIDDATSKFKPGIGTLDDLEIRPTQKTSIPEAGSINSLPTNEPFNPESIFPRPKIANENEGRILMMLNRGDNPPVKRVIDASLKDLQDVYSITKDSISPAERKAATFLKEVIKQKKLSGKQRESTLAPRIAQRVTEVSNRLREEGKTVISGDKTGVRWDNPSTGEKGFEQIKWKNDPNWIGSPVAPESMLKLDKLGIKGEDIPPISGPPQVDAPYAPEIGKIKKPFSDESGIMNISGVGSPFNDLKTSRFGKSISKAMEETSGGLTGAIDVAGNTMKSAMSTGDLSAPLRQGAPLLHKKEFREALPNMIKMFQNESHYVNKMGSIKNDPLFKFADDMGLELTGLNRGKEERFLNTIIEDIPVYGKVVRASDRAYTGFLNDLRFSTYKSLLNDATKSGLSPGRNKELAREIATFVNEATGRGSLGEMGEKAAHLLNAAFYSPKLLASRVRLINRVVNPWMYHKQSAFVRKEALKSALSMASFNITVNGLATAAGGKITYDITNSDFMKNRFKNTRVDFGAGFLQPIVFAGRLITAKYTSSTTGKTSELGRGYGQTSDADLIWRFLTSKEAPLIGLAGDIWTGKDWKGDEKNRATAIMERFIPMVVQDLNDIIKDDPKMIPLIIPGIFGASVQTYKNPNRGLRLPSMGLSMPSGM